MTDETLDCSDIDQYLGKPMQPGRLKEPLSNNDIRRWVQAMHYPNRLHYEDEFAAASRFGGIIAPHSFAVATDDGHGTAPSCMGRIPRSHLLFGGDEWWFHGPRIRAGDLVYNERVPFDYTVKQTKFAGPTCFQRGDNHYYTDKGDKVATQRSTAIRYRADLARETQSLAATEDPVWTDAELSLLGRCISSTATRYGSVLSTTRPEGQFETLEEILRLEPVAGMLRRRAAERVARVAQFDRDLRPNVTASCNEPSSKAGNAKCVRSQPLSPAKA